MPQNNLPAFQQDLLNPSAGTSSDLYHAVTPLITSSDENTLKGYDAERITKLKEDVRKGLVGLEYLTGAKSNKGETFYDAHPVQAVLTDVLKKSPLIGAGAALGGIGTNYLRQMQNMMSTEKAQMARANNPQDPTNPNNLLDSSRGPLREDIARTFGELSDDLKVSPELRFRRLDDLEQRSPVDMKEYPAKFTALETQRAEAIDNYRKQYSAIQNEQAKAIGRIQKGEPIANVIADMNLSINNGADITPEAVDNYFRNKLSDLDIGYNTAISDYKTKANSLMRNLETGGYAPQYKALEMQKSILTKQHNQQLEQLIATKNMALKKPLEEQFRARISEIEQAQKNLVNQARQSPAQAKLRDYANFMESLKRKQDSGKPFKPYIGEGLHNIGDNKYIKKVLEHPKVKALVDTKGAQWVLERLKSLLPGKYQAVGDLLEKGNITGADKFFNEGLIGDIMQEVSGGKDFSAANPNEHAFANTTLKDIKNPKYHSSGLRKAWTRTALPIAAGTGIALGGQGLYALVKAIQNRAFEDEKIKEWKKTLLKSRGNFDAAEQIK